jgi:prepilin-type N-terminal cleavage/methylation domain-containing protein
MTGKNLSTINQKPSTAQSAFTLVELAIVIVIIGLLVGGVLQGQELIKQAGARNNVKRIQEINAAIATFYGKYNCLPADCINAVNYGLYFANGDGDGKILMNNNNFFWLHLVAAKMLNVQNIDGTAMTSGNFSQYAKFRNDKSGSTSTFNMSGYMYASYGDIYSGTDSSISFTDSTAITVYANTITITSSKSNGSQVYATFTANETRQIDEKIDDGNALTGKLYGVNSHKDSDYSIMTCNTSGVYAANSDDLACRIIFQIGF